MSEESLETEDVELNNIGIYEGERNENRQRHGHGKAVLPNGDTYEGNYTEGKRNGFGTYRFKKNRAQYAGNYIYNIRQGYGTMIYPDGSKYEGNWTLGQKNGFGKYHYTNGDVYEGEWKKEKRHGLGAYFHADTGTYYKGWWENGQREGPAEVIFLGYKYIGTYKKNKAFGPGKFEFSNNSEATGTFISKSTETDEEGEEEEEFWKNKTMQWKTVRINDLSKQPPPLMQELIDERMKNVRQEMYELDRMLIQSMKPVVKTDLPMDGSLTDVLGTGPGDSTSLMMNKMVNFVEGGSEVEEEEEEEDDEQIDESCLLPENTLAFTTQEIEQISQQVVENQPSAY